MRLICANDAQSNTHYSASLQMVVSQRCFFAWFGILNLAHHFVYDWTIQCLFTANSGGRMFALNETGVGRWSLIWYGNWTRRAQSEQKVFHLVSEFSDLLNCCATTVMCNLTADGKEGHTRSSFRVSKRIRNFLLIRKALGPMPNGWMHAHDAIRAEIELFVSSLEPLIKEELSTAKVECTGIQTAWKCHSDDVRAHNSNEDLCLFPSCRHIFSILNNMSRTTRPWSEAWMDWKHCRITCIPLLPIFEPPTSCSLILFTL